MKIVKQMVVVIFLLILYTYVSYFAFLPDSYILMQGEEFNIPTLWGINILLENTGNTVEAVSNINKTKINEIGKKEISLKLFNSLKLKDCNINVIPKTKVIPIGKSIGMKLYTDGVLVVGMSEIEGKKPYASTGIKEGDRIIQINENNINNTEDLINQVSKSNGNELSIKYVRNEKTSLVNITPTKSSENEYKLGLWVRDAAAGVGTLTFYESSSKNFATLGHGIMDIDTDKLIKIANGELVTTKILNIQKGEKGRPGEIKGTIENGKKLGEISKNTNFGVFGKLDNLAYLNTNQQEMDVCYRNEIKQGKAQIICEVENGKQEKYDIEIEKIFLNNNENNKSMLIKITDERLINKTGGIIQGMSGAPIIQNGKFIGAVTNVLVNDPTMGYGVFADIMLVTR